MTIGNKMFAQELNFFIRNQEDLVRKYQGKALVIQGDTLRAVFDTPLEAYLHLERDHQLGKAMIQLCQPGPEAYTATID
jgi:hypothetical protein